MFIFDVLAHSFFDYIIYGFLLMGVGSFLMSKRLGLVLGLGDYSYVIKPISILIVMASVFLLGASYATKHHNEEISKFKDQIRIAEEKSQNTNIIIQTDVIEKIKIVKETTNANIQYIDRIVTQYDNLCTLSNATISLHNSSSQNEVSGSTGSPNEGTSDVKASDLIRTVTENYGTYYEVREQLLGWQRWYREQRKIHDTVK